MVSFSQLPAVTKDTIFGAARKNVRPFLFRDGFRKMLSHAKFRKLLQQSTISAISSIKKTHNPGRIDSLAC